MYHTLRSLTYPMPMPICGGGVLMSWQKIRLLKIRRKPPENRLVFEEVSSVF